MDTVTEPVTKVSVNLEGNSNAVEQRHSPSRGEEQSFCGTFSFPWLLSVSVVKLGIYLNKLYQDSAAVAVYYEERDLNCCIVSASCLFIPALIYIIYVVSIYVKQNEAPERKEVGTRVVHGMLLVPWQIKGRVEVLHFSAQRVCQRRVLTAEEAVEKSTLERQAAVLEFFEEFYAGFIQLLLQLYIIIMTINSQGGSKALPAEIIASALTLMSMMMAVRRKDDGILTGTLSVIGWLSIVVSRSTVIALATTVLHGWMVMLCLLHGSAVALWISSIAHQSHCESSFSLKGKAAMFFLSFTVFGLPSLTYWPVMFQLKERKRPVIFLILMLAENCVLLGAWYFLRQKGLLDRNEVILISIIVSGYFVGAMFILLYIFCKPKYTDQVVYHDMRIQNAESFGMYFEFCDLTFKLPHDKTVEDKLKMVREEETL